MAVWEVSIAAATAVVGYDLLTGLPMAKSSGASRALRSGGVAGSAAALDTAVDVMIGGVIVGKLHNVSTGMVQSDRDMTDFGDLYIPPGEALSLLVTDAPATNPINARLVVEEIAA